MRVEEGVPKSKKNKEHNRHEGAPEIVGVGKTLRAGGSAKKRSSSGLPNEQASADEDEDENV